MGSVKGRSGCGWFFAGFLLGPIGIIIAAVVKRIEPEVKITMRRPVDFVEGRITTTQVNNGNKEEHLQSLLKQATNLKNSDIDTAIRIVKQVINEYEKDNRPFEEIRPIYFKLAHYFQKKGNRDEAWRTYNRMISEAIEEDPQFTGIYQGQIYSRMASLREKEKAYKDAARFRIHSYISTNTALHLQDRGKEIIPLKEFHKQLKALFKKGNVEYPQHIIEKILNPLIKELRKKGPVREPFIQSPAKNAKINKRFGKLSKLTSETIKAIQKEFAELR